MTDQIGFTDTSKLNFGWYGLKPTGIVKYTEDPTKAEEGKPIPYEVICLTPMIPTAILENIDTKEQRIELTYVGQKQTETLIIDRETLVNKNKVVCLAKYGIAVGSVNAGKVSAYFNEVLGRSASVLPRKVSKSTLGWVGRKLDYFLPYSDGFVLDNASDQHVIDLIEAMQPKGDEAEWFKRMGELRKSMPVRIAMAATFASVIIEPVGQNSFIVHIWGGTGLGKTLLLKLIMTIWGNPNSSTIVRSLNCTENSMMSQASFLHNIPFAGDELQTIKTRYSNYDKLVMDITEGINRGRLGSDSKQQRTLTWRNAFLFCGEEPIVKQDSGGGVFARVVEIELTQKYTEDGNELANFLADNYGFAAERFIAALSGFDLKLIYRDYAKKLSQDKTLNEKQVGAAALIMTADFISSSLFWTDEREMQPTDITPYLKTAEQTDVTERAYKAVTGMVVQYAANFSEEPKEAWGRFDEDGDVVYILKSVLSERMQKMGFDFEACKKKWDRNGYLRRDKSGRLQNYTSICGHKAYCICIVMPKEPKEQEDVLTDHDGEIPW